MRLIRYLIVGVLSVPLYAVESGPEGASIEGEKSVVMDNPLEDTTLKSPAGGASETDSEEARRRKENRAAYYKERREKSINYAKEYRKKNRKKINQRNKDYYKKNKDKMSQYYKDNKEKIKKYKEHNKENQYSYAKKYQEKNKERIAAQKKEYQQRKKAERLAALRAEEPGELAALEVVRKQVHREEDPSDVVPAVDQERNRVPGVISGEVPRGDRFAVVYSIGEDAPPGGLPEIASEEEKNRERKSNGAAYFPEYYNKNRDKILANVEAYKKNNKDKILAYNRAYQKLEEQDAVQGAGELRELAALEVVGKQAHREKAPSSRGVVPAVDQEGNVVSGVISGEGNPFSGEGEEPRGG